MFGDEFYTDSVKYAVAVLIYPAFIPCSLVTRLTEINFNEVLGLMLIARRTSRSAVEDNSDLVEFKLLAGFKVTSTQLLMLINGA